MIETDDTTKIVNLVLEESISEVCRVESCGENLETIDVLDIVNPPKKCEGYRIEIYLFDRFPVHLLKDMDIVVEGFVLHHNSCYSNLYSMNSDFINNVNKNCQDLLSGKTNW